MAFRTNSERDADKQLIHPLNKKPFTLNLVYIDA